MVSGLQLWTNQVILLLIWGQAEYSHCGPIPSVCSSQSSKKAEPGTETDLEEEVDLAPCTQCCISSSKPPFSMTLESPSLIKADSTALEKAVKTWVSLVHFILKLYQILIYILWLSHVLSGPGCKLDMYRKREPQLRDREFSYGHVCGRLLDC